MGKQSKEKNALVPGDSPETGLATSQGLEEVAKEGELIPEHLGVLGRSLIKIFPVHVLTDRQYIELGLMSLAGAIWMSFIHTIWWGVEKAFSQGVFYCTSLQLILTAHAVFKLNAENGQKNSEYLLSAVRLPIVVGFFLSFLVWAAVGFEFRILADETNFLGSALSFYMDQTYFNITEGTFYYDSFRTLEKVIDKRPPLFPYFIAIYHFLFGYNANHGFWVNLTVAFATGGLFFHIGRKYLGISYGLLVVACYSAIPISLIGMSSSGFEPMTALFNTLVLWQCVEFLRHPSTLRMEVLLLLLLAASQGRYESIVLAIPVGVVILARFKQIKWRPSALRMLVIPYLFIPVNWQKQITSSVNAGDPLGTVTFSLKNLVKHTTAWIEYWFDWKFVGYPTQLPLTLLACLGLGLAFKKAFEQSSINSEVRALSRWVLFLGFLGVFGLLVPQLSYYMGSPKEPAGHRVAISYAPAAAFLAAYALWVLFNITRKGLFIPGFAVVLIFIGTSHAARNPLGKTLVLFREYKEFLNFVKKQPRTGTLVVADRPGMFVVHGYGAISFETLRNQAAEWKSSMERRLYTNVIIEQQIYYDTNKPAFPELPEGFGTETLFEFQNDSEYFMRYSRLIPHTETQMPILGINPGNLKSRTKNLPHQGHGGSDRAFEPMPHGQGIRDTSGL